MKKVLCLFFCLACCCRLYSQEGKAEPRPYAEISLGMFLNGDNLNLDKNIYYYTQDAFMKGMQFKPPFGYSNIPLPGYFYTPSEKHCRYSQKGNAELL